MKSAMILLFAAFVAAAQAQVQTGVKLPPYTREVLPNGVVVLMVPHAGLPLTNVRVLVRGGEESEPSSLAGLSAVKKRLAEGAKQVLTLGKLICVARRTPSTGGRRCRWLKAFPLIFNF